MREDSIPGGTHCGRPLLFAADDDVEIFNAFCAWHDHYRWFRFAQLLLNSFGVGPTATAAEHRQQQQQQQLQQSGSRFSVIHQLDSYSGSVQMQLLAMMYAHCTQLLAEWGPWSFLVRSVLCWAI